MFQMCEHSEHRAAQRCLTVEEVEYVTHFGKRYFSDGAIIYYLRRKDLPAYDRRMDQWTRLIGTAVVLTVDRQLVITVWRNRKSGLKFIRRRSGFPQRGKQKRGEEETAPWGKIPIL
jgi:hypothetical protein